MSDVDIYDDLQSFCDANHYVAVDDKLPIFICSIGAHIFNAINKCSRCDFTVEDPVDGYFSIPNCPLRHDNPPIYTPMSRLADTRVHILMRGKKGSGKNVLIDLFLAEGTGLIWNPEGFNGIGFRTMIGANSITEAGLFGSVNEDGYVAGRPVARELCGGFLGFEEFSSLTDATKKDHSMDMKNQLLTSLDSGRVNKGMRHGWVRYNTRYTCWAGTQPARFELESGLDRRFFIIEIEMSPKIELEYKIAQNKQARMTPKERAELATKAMEMRGWFYKRMEDAVLNPPTSVMFSPRFEEWVLRDTVRSFEADLFRRLAIGYAMMQPEYKGGEPLLVDIDDRLSLILMQSLNMRRTVMDADVALIKSMYWNQDIPKSTLLKEIARIITNGDYQSAKRWVEENLIGESWYEEHTPKVVGKRGRRGVACRIGEKQPEPDEHYASWGNGN